jgi:hypothetical protein
MILPVGHDVSEFYNVFPVIAQVIDECESVAWKFKQVPSGTKNVKC